MPRDAGPTQVGSSTGSSLTTRFRLDRSLPLSIMADMKSCTPPRRAAQGLLGVLAFVLPFEAPLFRVGPLQVTTVELALYAMLSAWGVAVAWDVSRDRAWFGRAVEAWAAIRGDGATQAAAWRGSPFSSSRRSRRRRMSVRRSSSRFAA